MVTKKKQSRKPTVHQRLKQKLNPARFDGMSVKMAAIVGYIIGAQFTCPSINDMVITSDGFVMARRSDDIGMNEFIGSESDLKSNWTRLLATAGLTQPEKKYADMMYQMRIRRA